MSLRDTIVGAREEAAQSGNPFARTSEGKDEAPKKSDSESSGKSTSGFSRRSTARAKPQREAAGSVRYVSSDEYHDVKSEKSSKELTRAERHAKADRERSAEDRRSSVARSILNGHAEYKRGQRIWWTLIGIGMAAVLVSWLASTFIPNSAGQIKVVVAIVLLVAAYGAIIAAFVYDWRVIRPMRKAADDEVARMSDKRIKQYLNAQLEAAHQDAANGVKDESFFSRIFHRN